MRTTKILNASRRHFCQQTATKESLSTVQALQSLEDLYSIKKPKRSSFVDKNEIIDRAKNIYHGIVEPKDVQIITKFVRICIDYDRMGSFKVAWSDIAHLHRTSNHNKECTMDRSDFPYELLFKCSMKSNDINKAIQILKWIEAKDDDRTLNINDSFITKLITKCKKYDDRANDMKLIHKLLQNARIQCQK